MASPQQKTKTVKIQKNTAKRGKNNNAQIAKSHKSLISEFENENQNRVTRSKRNEFQSANKSHNLTHFSGGVQTPPRPGPSAADDHHQDHDGIDIQVRVPPGQYIDSSDEDEDYEDDEPEDPNQLSAPSQSDFSEVSQSQDKLPDSASEVTFPNFDLKKSLAQDPEVRKMIQEMMSDKLKETEQNLREEILREQQQQQQQQMGTPNNVARQAPQAQTSTS